MGWKCGMKRSTRCNTKAPSIIPNAVTHGPLKSIAGTIKLNDVAASITPAENPSITSNSLSDICLVKRTGNAPAPVARPATKLASAPNQIMSDATVFPLISLITKKRTEPQSSI
jgi:hypothetical protein